MDMDVAVGTTDLDKTMGAFYIGVLFCGTLLGVLTLQCFSYYRSRSWADPIPLQLLVLGIWCLDCMHQVFVSHAVYRYLVSNFMNGAHLEHILWTAVLEVVVTGVIGMLVHGFYVTRIYKLSNQIAVAAPLALGAVAELAFAVVFSVKALRLVSFDDYDQVKNWFFAANAVFSAVSCAVTVVYFFYIQAQPTKYTPHDKNAIERGITLCLDTGLLACIAAIAALISTLARPETFIYAPFIFCLGRLFAISFLSTLNGTGPKRTKPSSTNIDSKNVYQPRAEMHRMSAFAGRNRGPGRDVSVHIDTVQYVNRDDDYDYESSKEKLSPISPLTDSTASAV